MTQSKMQAFSDTTFEEKVLGSPRPVLVEFGATWCGPCKALAPIVHKLAEERAGEIDVGAIDIDDAPSVATRFGIRGVPTLVIFSGGKEVARHVGLANHAKLTQMVDGVTGALARTEVA